MMYSCFSNDTAVSQSKTCTEYSLNLSEGFGTATVYPVFPGAEIVCLEIQAGAYRPCLHNSEGILEINHCRKGRAECVMGDGCFQYLGENDLFLNMQTNRSEKIELPLGYYSGIDILLEISEVTNCLPSLLPDYPIDLQAKTLEIFAHDDCFFIQAKQELQGIYSGMYEIDKKARPAYFKLKILELLIFLSLFKPGDERQKKPYSRQFVEITKQIQKQITAEPNRRFTIEALARQHCISETALKANFKDVFGMSTAAYMKDYRIRQAAVLLKDTEKSVAEIALEFGYESQSKFAAAFKEIMKTSPSSYRRKHHCTGI